MTVAVRGRLPSDPAKAFQEIQERLMALERDAAGSGASFTSPTVPAFGAGIPAVIGGGASVPPPVLPPGVTDHGALMGLEDNDHPQYVQHGESVRPHSHGPFDVSGLAERFVERFERVFTPHTHGAGDILGLDEQRSRSSTPHMHTVGDLADFRTDAEHVLMMRIFGG